MGLTVAKCGCFCVYWPTVCPTVCLTGLIGFDRQIACFIGFDRQIACFIGLIGFDRQIAWFIGFYRQTAHFIGFYREREELGLTVSKGNIDCTKGLN